MFVAAQMRDGSPGRRQSLSIASEAKGTVAMMHQEIISVEGVIDDLNAQNEKMKLALLRNRHGILEKYFMATDHLLKQACLREWYFYLELVRKARAIEGLQNISAADRANMDKGLLELEHQCHQAQLTLAQREREKKLEQLRLEQAENQLRTVLKQMNNYDVGKRQPSVPMHEAESHITKGVRTLLRDVGNVSSYAQEPGSTVKAVRAQSGGVATNYLGAAQPQTFNFAPMGSPVLGRPRSVAQMQTVY